MSVSAVHATTGGKQGWESSDFPIVCETCLGENPYIRMTKAEFDKECKICARPFTVFRWKPGKTARYKKTEICQTCAKMKNVCQTCLLDLEFGLPVQVRDAAMPAGSQLVVPQSDVNREWQADIQEKESGRNVYGRMELRQQLSKVMRTTPYYKRNEAHVCSFFVKGQCNRGASCPYRHEMPDHDKESDFSRQNIRDRYYGKNDPVAKKILTKLSAHKLNPPADKSITTLYLGNVPDTITEQDIRDVFYSYGEIKEVKLVPKSMCAFVSYTSRMSAEQAAENLHNNLEIKGNTLRLSWAKPQTFGEAPPVETATSEEDNYFSLPTPAFAPPPNPRIAKPHYPSMSPQRFGTKRDR